MKRIISILILSMVILLLPACKDQEPPSEEFRAGVNLNMTYDEVMKAEQENGVTFVEDLSNSKVTPKHIFKTYNSEITVKYESMEGTLTYVFLDDKLVQCLFTSPYTYTADKILDQLTYAKYMELVLAYTEAQGNPSTVDNDLEGEYNDYYTSIWSTDSCEKTYACVQTFKQVGRYDPTEILEDTIWVYYSLPEDKLKSLSLE